MPEHNNIRGLKRVDLRISLLFTVMLTYALVKIDKGEKEKIGKMKGRKLATLEKVR